MNARVTSGSVEVVRLPQSGLRVASEMLARAFQRRSGLGVGAPRSRAARRAPALALPRRLRRDRRRRLDDAGRRPRGSSLAPARPDDDARRRRAPRRRHDPAPAGLGDRAASSPTAGPSRRCAPRLRRGRTGTSPGSASTHRRAGRGSAPRCCSRASTGARRDGLPCLLLTNNEANLSFYAGHGFEVVLEGETPAGGPHAWAMVKEP